jgi:hypothetical protein
MTTQKSAFTSLSQDQHGGTRAQTDKMEDAGYTVVRFKHTDNWQNIIAELPSIFGKG